jgi:hypothetical protein
MLSENSLSRVDRLVLGERHYGTYHRHARAWCKVVVSASHPMGLNDTQRAFDFAR